MHAHYQMDDTSTVLHKAPITFDVSVWELLGAVAGWCAPGDREARRTPGARLPGAVDGRRIGDDRRVRAVHAGAVHVGQHAATTVLAPLLIAGGEALPPELAARVTGDGIVLDNVYGPTEVAIGATAYRCAPSDLAAAPIGRAVWNTRAYVLDPRLRPVPVGVSGELYLAGVRVARG